MRTGKYIAIFLTALFFCSRLCAQDTKIDSLLQQLTKAKDDSNKVMLLRNIGNTIANQDPQEAIGYWKLGVLLSKKINFINGLARNFTNIGTGFAYLGKFDSSIIYCDSAIIYCRMINDPEKLALVYLNKGDAYRGLGDFKSALLYCDTARMYAVKTTNTDRQARIYTIISNIYSEQKLFTNASLFLNKAIELYKKDDNMIMVGQSYDDLGIIYQQSGKLDSALFFRKKAVNIGESEEDLKNLSTYYFGVADIYTDMHQYKEAERLANKSLEHAKQQENDLQLGTSYNLLCKIYLKQKKIDEAIKAGNMAWDISTEDVQLSTKQETAILLADAYTAMGNYKEANRFITIGSNLKDSLTKQLFNDQVAGLQASFELKEKDKEILLLGKDKELQQQKLIRQRVMFGAAAGLLLFSLLGIVLLINRNRLRQRMKELELRNQIAADLHDEVGSSLSSIHMLSQMATQGNETTQKDILEKMSNNAKETMDKMGDIVWMIKPGETEAGSLKFRMERFAYEIGSSRNIELQMQLDDLEKVKPTMEQRKNIYLIFKEAVNNAVKYSGTKKIEINSSTLNKELTLQVKDFGKGFDSNTVKKGNGLDNMQNRAKELKGRLEIASSNEGCMVKLVVPVS